MSFLTFFFFFFFISSTKDTYWLFTCFFLCLPHNILIVLVLVLYILLLTFLSCVRNSAYIGWLLEKEEFPRDLIILAMLENHTPPTPEDDALGKD